MKLNNKGQAILIGVVVVLLILAFLLPILIHNVMNESRWTAKEQHSTFAMQLAESAIEQGYQKIMASSATWQSIVDGNPLAGYNFDQTYNNPAGGVYEIRMVGATGGITGDQVTITGIAKHKKEMRVIQAIYTKGSGIDTNVGLYANSIGGAGSPVVYWGAIMSQTDLRLTGPAAASYPNIYAGGTLQMAGATPPAPFFNTRCDPPPYQGNPIPGSNPPAYQWNCNASIPVPNPPNFSYYKDLAIQQGNICNGQPCYDGPWKSGSGTLSDPVCVDGAGNPKVWYISSGSLVRAGNMYLCGVLIVQNGGITFSGGGAPAGSISVPVPSNAWRQYQAGSPNHRSPPLPAPDYGPDTIAVDEYPGDGGLHTTNATYDFAVGGGGFSAMPLMFKGYIYVANQFAIGSNTAIVGAVEVGGTVTGAGTYSIFYTPQTVIRGASNPNLTRASWREWPGCRWESTDPHPICP